MKSRLITLLFFLTLSVGFCQPPQRRLLQSSAFLEYQAVISKAHTLKYRAPSTLEKAAQSRLLQRVKNYGILAKLDDWIVIVNDGSNNFTTINWKNPSVFQTAKVNGPAFTVNGGVTFNGVDNYIDTNFSPSGGTNFTQNNNEQIIYYGTISSTNNVNFSDGVRTSSGNNTTTMNPQQGSTQVSYGASNTGATTVSDAQFDRTAGLYFWGRTASNVTFVKKGTGSRVAGSGTSQTPSIYNFFLGVLNTGGSTTVSTFNSRTIYMYAAGASLTTTDESNFKTAWDEYLTSISLITTPPTIGTLYNVSSWSGLSDFTNNGSLSASIVGSAIRITNGSSTYAKTLDISTSTCNTTKLAKWVMSVNYTIGTVSATSKGCGIGIRSTNGSTQYDGGAIFDTSTGTNTGRVSLFKGAGHTLNTSASISISSGDNITLTCTLNEEAFNAVVVNNTTSGTASISYSYTSASPFLPNTGRFAIFSLSTGAGDTFDVNSLTVSSTEYYQPKLAFLGDSKTQYYEASSIRNAYPYVIQDSFGRVTVLGGGSDRSAEYVSRLAEITNIIKPQIVFVGGISNDIRTGVASGTWQANIDTIISTLESAGITVIFSDGLYETAIDQSPVSTYLSANHPSEYWHSNAITLTLNADNIHPDNAGHATFGAAVLSSGLLPVWY